MYFDSSMTILLKTVENVKLRQIIAKIDFLLIFQQKENVLENLTSIACQGNIKIHKSC